MPNDSPFRFPTPNALRPPNRPLSPSQSTCPMLRFQARWPESHTDTMPNVTRTSSCFLGKCRPHPSPHFNDLRIRHGRRLPEPRVSANVEWRMGSTTLGPLVKPGWPIVERQKHHTKPVPQQRIATRLPSSLCMAEDQPVQKTTTLGQEEVPRIVGSVDRTIESP